MKEKRFEIISLNNYPSMLSSFTGRTIPKRLVKKIQTKAKTKKVKLFSWHSMMFNKSFHLTNTLKANLTTKDMSILEIYALKEAFNKEAGIIGSIGGYTLGTIRHVSKLFRFKNESIKHKLAKKNTIPVVFLSTGANDLMYYTAQNPWGAKLKETEIKSRENLIREINPIDKTLSEIKKSVEEIRRVNDNAIIIIPGLYVHKTYENPKLNTFKDLTIKYNQELQTFCNENNIIYYDVCDKNHHLQMYTEKKLNSLARNIIEKARKYKEPDTYYKDKGPVQSGLNTYLTLNEERKPDPAFERNIPNRNSAIKAEQDRENKAITCAKKRVLRKKAA